MYNFKITTNKTFTMSEIESYTELVDLGGKKIDYKYSDSSDSNPKFNYFEIVMNGQTKVLAVSGKTEIWEIPDIEGTKIKDVEEKT